MSASLNRPVRVKRFQTIHGCGVDVARGLELELHSRILRRREHVSLLNTMLRLLAQFPKQVSYESAAFIRAFNTSDEAHSNVVFYL